jgi:hypothetical protein
MTGAVSTSPPDDLCIQLTTSASSDVYPTGTKLEHTQPSAQAVTVTPRADLIPPLPVRSMMVPIPTKDRIETPSWVMVKPGEDDEEEAKEEIGQIGVSPSKRRRRSALSVSRVQLATDGSISRIHPTRTMRVCIASTRHSSGDSGLGKRKNYSLRGTR